MLGKEKETKQENPTEAQKELSRLNTLLQHQENQMAVFYPPLNHQLQTLNKCKCWTEGQTE